MIFLIYYLFLSHIKRYKLILQAYKKYKVVEVGLATTFLAKSVMFLRACAFVHWHSPKYKNTVIGYLLPRTNTTGV